MKNILCVLGIHKPSKFAYDEVKITKVHRTGKHTWHKNYEVCERCGKRLYRIKKIKGEFVKW